MFYAIDVVLRSMDHFLKFLLNSEVEKIRVVPRGVQYGSVSAPLIDISLAESASAHMTNTDLIILPVSHMQKPFI